MLEMTNPTAPVSATAGPMNAFLAGSNMDSTTQKLALKVIFDRVAVSPSVAALMASHAGLGPQAVR